MTKITLKSLAQALNMSISTVSKALNDSHEISEETKKRVREYAQQHNYQPNIIAQILKTGKTNTIGVVLPKMSSPFESQMLEGIQKAASNQNFRVVIMNSMENEETEKTSVVELIAKGIDGLLFCPIHEHSNIAFMQEIAEQTPVVIFDRTNYPIDTHKVGVLNLEGTYDACKHLFDIGRKDIAVCCGVYQGITADRLAGYKMAHEDLNIPVKEEFIVYLDIKDIEELHRGLTENVTRLLALPQPPNAILGTSDTVTTHLLGILANMGVAVPEQLAVLGFANTNLAMSLNPSLTTIRQPATEIGEIATGKLLEVINKKDRSQIEWENVKLPTTIRPRKSTQL